MTPAPGRRTPVLALPGLLPAIRDRLLISHIADGA